MRRSALLPLILAPLMLQAQEQEPAPSSSPELEQLRLLRAQIEAQSKQIEQLAQQVSKLSQTLESQKSPGTHSGPQAAQSSQPSAPAAQPSNTAPTGRAVIAADTNVPHHIVGKGETLTSIAKRYNTSVSELLSINKITDERKLQIGQTLILPASAATPAPAPKAPTLPTAPEAPAPETNPSQP